MKVTRESTGMKLDEAIKKIREGEKRKFSQTIDLIVNIRNIDLKNPANKFSKDVLLPHGRGKDISVCIISDTISGGINKNDIEEFSRNKSAAKQFTKKYDFFVCEAPLMPLVGKVLGRYLGPKGKMPRLLLPGKDPKSMIDESNKSVRIMLRESPTIQIPIGSEDMQDNQIKENVEKVLVEVKKSIPPKAQLKNAYIKMTMGNAVKIGVM